MARNTTTQKQLSALPDTSGWVEGINNKVKVIKRRCYGITNLKHLFQRIFLDLQGYDVFLLSKPLIIPRCGDHIVNVY